MENPVYQSTKWLANLSQDVFTSRDRIRATAAIISNYSFEYPTWRDDCLPLGDGPEVLEFFFIINCLNFKFWYTDSKERFSASVPKKYFGAFAMFALLNNWLSEVPDLVKADYLRSLDIDEARYRLTGDRGPIPMLEERVRILNEVGEVLSEKYGDFSNLVRKSSFLCFNNGNGIVERLVKDFPSFGDEYTLNRKKIIFNKRAQLAPAMVGSRFRRNEVVFIKDVEKLTAFADYQVPKGLCSYGILEYSEALRNRISKKEILECGSREELEIRANTIYAVEKLIKEINSIRMGVDPVNAVQMDYHLWKMARKEEKQYHLTVTTAY